MESSASARMSPATRLFLAGNTVSMLGTGLIVAFTLIYLHQVRGIVLPAVGGLLAAAGGAGLLVVPLASALRLMLVASLLIYFTGYPAVDSGLPAYATVEAHMSAHIVALSVTVNTAFIVATQLIVLRLVRRLRRSRALALVGLIWAASWVVFGLAALPIPLASRVACVFTFTAVFGLGETFVAPTLGPLLNTLADDRANSLSAFAQSLSFIVSPAIATGLIAAGAATVWISLLCVGCLGTVAIGARLSRTLTIRQDLANAPPAVAPARLSATGPGGGVRPSVKAIVAVMRLSDMGNGCNGRSRPSSAAPRSRTC
jgi:hypothetical protein